MVNESPSRQAWGTAADQWFVAVSVLLFLLVFAGSLGLVYYSGGNADMNSHAVRQHAASVHRGLFGLFPSTSSAARTPSASVAAGPVP
jgi:hypothetical protein